MANSSFLKSLLQPQPSADSNPNPSLKADSSPGTEKELVLTLADLEAEVPSSDLAQPNPFPKAKAKKGGTFLTKQFPLFTTSISLVYLQGVLPIQPDWTLANFLAHAKVRTVGSPLWRASNPTLTQSHLATLNQLRLSSILPKERLVSWT